MQNRCASRAAGKPVVRAKRLLLAGKNGASMTRIGPGDVADGSRSPSGRLGSPHVSGLRAWLARSPFGTDRLRGYWLTAPGKVMLIATALAVAIRLFTLLRPGCLTGVTEYDDGVYLGASIRLAGGAMPYKDYAFIQPPGILLLMSPVALIAKLTTTVTALALARVLTAMASAACVPLAGNLVRYRGTAVTVVTCGVIAIYPDDIATAHTLMLEPWMNLFCLLAINAAFHDGHLARPGHLAWAGAALGFACAIKFWAAAPAAVLLVACLTGRKGRLARLRACLLGLSAGFLLPVLPFLASAPAAFIRSTISDQVARAGNAVFLGVRVANLTGLIDIINNQGVVSPGAGAHSMFVAGSMASLGNPSSLGWLPVPGIVSLAGLVAAGYTWQFRRRTGLEWLSLATAVLASAAILSSPAFYYHYTDFPAPWLALALGFAAGALAGDREPRAIAVPAFAVLLALVMALQIREIFPLRQPTTQAMAHQIPPRSCLVTDDASLAIAAGRLASLPPGCPDIVDALAATLVLSNGVSVQGEAGHMPQVVAAWRSWLGKADYVWLSPVSNRRIPWTPALSAWFNANFTKLRMSDPGIGQLYIRVRT